MVFKTRIVFLYLLLNCLVSVAGVRAGTPHANPAAGVREKTEKVNAEVVGRAESDKTCLNLPEERQKELEKQVVDFTELKQEPFRHQLRIRQVVDGKLQDVYPYLEILEKRMELLKKIGGDLLDEPGCGLVMVRRLQQVLEKERDGKSLQELAVGDGHGLLAVGLDDLQRIFEGRLHKIPATSRDARNKLFAMEFPESLLYTAVDPDAKTLLPKNIMGPADQGYGQNPSYHPVLKPAAENFLHTDPAKHVFYLTQDLVLKDFQEERAADGKGIVSTFRLVPKSIVDSVKAAAAASTKEELIGAGSEYPGRRGTLTSPFSGGPYTGFYTGFSGSPYGPIDSSGWELLRSTNTLDTSYPPIRRKPALVGQWKDIDVYDVGLSLDPDFLTTIRPEAKRKDDPAGYRFKLLTDVSISNRPVLLEYRTNEINSYGVAGPRRERQIELKPPKIDPDEEE